MKIPEDCRFAYVVSHKAWYCDVIDAPSVTVCASALGGGVAWEFAIKEVELGGSPVIRAGVFNDAFAAFEQIPEFFATLGEERPSTLDAVVEILGRLGAVDETEYVRPAQR
ncbi:hypothetical protein ABZ917_17655 [Nonomuraea wenchangensis]